MADSKRAVEIKANPETEGQAQFVFAKAAKGLGIQVPGQDRRDSIGPPVRVRNVELYRAALAPMFDGGTDTARDPVMAGVDRI